MCRYFFLLFDETVIAGSKNKAEAGDHKKRISFTINDCGKN